VRAPTLVTSPSADAYLIAVPDAAPPYDCDIHGTACQSPRGPALSGATGGGLAAGIVAAPSAKPTAPSPLASCAGGAWPRQFAQAIVETLSGTRPMRQIIPWTTERAQAHIRTLCPLFRTNSAPRIQRVLSSSPSANVVEVAVIAGFGPRTRALAMRFEHIAARRPAPGLSGKPARWLCTDIETG
jgi:hypothetical protein